MFCTVHKNSPNKKGPLTGTFASNRYGEIKALVRGATPGMKYEGIRPMNDGTAEIKALPPFESIVISGQSVRCMG
jgi:hypothetical protein